MTWTGMPSALRLFAGWRTEAGQRARVDHGRPVRIQAARLRCRAREPEPCGEPQIRGAARAGACRPAASGAGAHKIRQLRTRHHGAHRNDSGAQEGAGRRSWPRESPDCANRGCLPKCPKPAANWSSNSATPWRPRWRRTTRKPRRSSKPPVQQYPQEANVHFRFGAFLNIQDSARGIEEIRKAVELAPDHVPALVGLTVMYLKREELDQAMEYGGAGRQSQPGRLLHAHCVGPGAAGERESGSRGRGTGNCGQACARRSRRPTSVWRPPIRGWAAKKMRRGSLRNSSAWKTWGNE